MRAETLTTAGIGITGTAVAWISSERVAILAGLSTAAWMLWQLGCSVYDRATGRKGRK